MKKLYKNLLITICITLMPLSSVLASVSDNNYLVFIWTPTSTLINPQWVDQFEFDAGDVFRVYTTRETELTGTWFETPLGSLTWFQGYVESEEESTTTTTPATSTTPTIQSGSMIRPLRETSKYDINLWGVSYEFVPPPPLDTFGYSIILGYGAYLGVNATFLGLASIPGPGDEPSFGGISPDEVVQEQSYTDVTITGVNTKFQDDPPVTITFTPSDGLTIKNISVISNTRIEFDLDVATNASTGSRSVTVTYDGGSKLIAGANVFEVKAK
jgi:hypothetical protein